MAFHNCHLNVYWTFILRMHTLSKNEYILPKESILSICGSVRIVRFSNFSFREVLLLHIQTYLNLT